MPTLHDPRILIPVNTGFGPLSPGGLKWWAKVDSITGVANGAGVSSLPDSSGNGFTLIAGSNPTMRSGGSSPLSTGLPVIEFNGTTNFLKNVSFIQAQPFSLFAVFKMLSLNATNTMDLLAIAGSTQGLTATAATGTIRCAYGSTVTGAALGTSAFHVLLLTLGSGTLNVWLDGTHTINAQPGGSNGYTAIGLAASSTGAASTFANMQFMEGGIYSSVLSLPTLQSLAAYCNARSGLTTTLPT